MKPASELKKLSDQRELERKQYWKNYNEIVSESHIKEIEETMNTPCAIYHREVTVYFGLGIATIKHIESLGYTVHTINPNHFQIRW